MGTDKPHTKAEGVAIILRIQNDLAKENAPGKEQREIKKYSLSSIRRTRPRADSSRRLSQTGSRG